MRDKARIILNTGSKGGGKSRAAMEKGHAFCLKYPGAMVVALRKTRESMTNGTIEFMRAKVVGPDPRVEYMEGKHRFAYKNGSFFAFGGMKDEDQKQQVRSMGVDGAIDIAIFEEGNAFERSDAHEVIACLRGKAGSFRQLIINTNPDGPDHWIREDFIVTARPTDNPRIHKGVTPEGLPWSVYYSSSVDNPFNPPDYAQTLSMLKGVDYQRLVLGQWVQAEGVVYDNFDVALNVADVEYNPEQYLLLGADDGYAEGDGTGTRTHHPRVFLVCQEDGRGGLNILAERYRTLEASYDDTFLAVEQMCREIGVPTEPDMVYVGPGAMMAGALGRHGWIFSKTTHEVGEGIRNVRRLVSDGHGWTGLRIHPRCVNLIREFQMYQYEEEGSVPGGERRPKKCNDHGPDCVRYVAWHMRHEN